MGAIIPYDRDRVVRTLTHCLEHGSLGGQTCSSMDACPGYDVETGCLRTLIREAIVLLKPYLYEASDLFTTLKGTPVYLDFKRGGTILKPGYALVYEIHNDRMGLTMADGRVHWLRIDWYGINWRAWSDKPYPVELKAARWEEKP